MQVAILCLTLVQHTLFYFISNKGSKFLMIVGFTNSCLTGTYSLNNRFNHRWNISRKLKPIYIILLKNWTFWERTERIKNFQYSSFVYHPYYYPCYYYPWFIIYVIIVHVLLSMLLSSMLYYRCYYYPCFSIHILLFMLLLSLLLNPISSF